MGSISIIRIWISMVGDIDFLVFPLLQGVARPHRYSLPSILVEEKY